MTKMKLYECISIFLALLCAFAQGDGCASGSIFGASYSNSDKSWEIKWNIDCSSNTFSAIITAHATGWVGFGLSKVAGSMVPADVLQASCDSSQNVTYLNGHTVDHVPPVPDSTDNYFDLNCTLDADVTTIGFNRLLSTVDSQGLSIINGNMNLLWALQSSDSSFTTEHSDMGSTIINFFTGKTMQYDPYVVHGILMIIAWALLSPIGTFIARYLKPIGHIWFQSHVLIQVLVLITMLVAFVIVEVVLGSSPSSHFLYAHNYFGITIIFLALLQGGLGYLANLFWDPNRKRAPAFPDRVHWYIGRLIFLLSVTNIFLGFDVYGFGIGPYISFGTWVALMVIALSVMYVRGNRPMGSLDPQKMTDIQIYHIHPSYRAV